MKLTPPVRGAFEVLTELKEFFQFHIVEMLLIEMLLNVGLIVIILECLRKCTLEVFIP